MTASAVPEAGESNPVDSWSIWLMPRAEDAEPLSALVRECAEALGSPPFEPHLTLHHGFPAPGVTREAAGEWLCKRMERIAPPELELRELRFGDRYTRGLVMALKPHPDAAGMARVAGELLVRTGGWKFWPHVSLAYGVVPDAHRKALKSRLASRLPARIRFDGFAILDCPRRVESHEDVRRWKVAWRGRWES